ncbi:hypothetical protein OIO90_002904 [Microbotryomycetes sp. JL221]|nr:hypothetical protein OIO90_002904 [Microbotryomycetes sp. JL221]
MKSTRSLRVEKHASTTSCFTVDAQLSAYTFVVMDLMTTMTIVVLVCIIHPMTQHQWPMWLSAFLALVYIRIRTTTVIHESILAVRGLGVQLCTTRGIVLPIRQRSFKLLQTYTQTTLSTQSTSINNVDSTTSSSSHFKTIRLSSSKTFLPFNSISDIIINESIWRWQIIYYLVILINSNQQQESEIQSKGLEQSLTTTQTNTIKLQIAFPELLPKLDMIRRVWIGVRHTLFDELDLDQTQGQELVML